MSLAPETTIGAALGVIARRLAEAGVDQPKREARWLVSAALNVDPGALLSSETRPLGPAHARLEAIVLRRCRHEPLSRILGEAEFFGLPLRLNAATLDPRADTETLVEAVLERMKRGDATGEPAWKILDLGTGSGAILLAVLSRLPMASGLGIDLAPEAVAIARHNAESLGLGARARFATGDLMEGLEQAFDVQVLDAQVFDVIVSNPPYIPSAEIATLDPEVRLHDPHLALDGGADGLVFYRRIAAGAASRLKPGGLLALEVGAGQAALVADLLDAEGFTRIEIVRDPGQIDRVVLCRRA